MMSKKDEALKLALEALEYLCKPILHGWEAETQKEKRDQAITALREALEKAELHKLASDSLTEGLRLNDWNKIGCVNHDCDKCKTLAEQPAPEAKPHEQEPCGGCGGSGWVIRDPDIGTDQECFVCDGRGTVEPEQPSQQEPVAEIQEDMKGGGYVKWLSEDFFVAGTKLYTSPPTLSLAQRQARSADTWVHATGWRGLTDDETEHLWEISRAALPRYYTFKTLIEKALRERNT
jgi:hypothetical protein